GSYSEENPDDRNELSSYLRSSDSPVEVFEGVIQVIAGRAVTSDHTVLHNRSISEDVHYSIDGAPYSGPLNVSGGKLVTEVDVDGKSLVHSVDLTTEAFSRGVFGDYGRDIVAIGL
ncbi:MAG TPA: sodium:alanine symporter family protein, partial [Gammaproteobacteria bacterium]|nr:sodium:alanine symporter family protein [Gammaproteobacteria bacterium]